MGEWSKKVGETGEAIAGDFLRTIGWIAAQSGIELSCARPEAHQNGDHQRRTHGIDYFASHRSPLIDGVGQNLIVSVKFSAEPYPKNPSRIFKQHFADLAHTIECFKNSKVRQAAIEAIKGVSGTQDIGILFWISNDRQGDGDIVSKVERVIVPDTLNYETVYLVDNRRAQFVFDSVNYAKRIANGSDVAFFYPDTGKNVIPQTKQTHGSILPVEFINSSVLVFRLAAQSSQERTLVLSTIETFSETGLKRLMGLAQSISQDWCSKVIIAFPDYDGLNHKNTVQSAKSCFVNSSFTAGTEVCCYDEDFRSTVH